MLLTLFDAESFFIFDQEKKYSLTRTYMPQHISAERRVRLSEKRRARNRSNKTKMRNLIKSVSEAKNKEEALNAYKATSSLLDKLAAKKVIHPNAAANQKSRLSKIVKSLST